MQSCWSHSIRTSSICFRFIYLIFIHNFTNGNLSLPRIRHLIDESSLTCCFDSTSSHRRRVTRVGLPVRLPRVPFHQRRRRRGRHAPSHGHRGSRLPVARQPLSPVTEAAPLRSECLLDLDAPQRGLDANSQRLQLSANTLHHREVVSRGGHHREVVSR